ncbi:MAG: hydrogenase [Lentisphaerae bacterium]|nr:hydrogenase [Lentisphaerota bacterium]
MTLILTSLIVWLAGALVCLARIKRVRIVGVFGPAFAVVGSILAALPVFFVLFSGKEYEFSIPWQLPLGSFHLKLDSLSGLFALPIVLVIPVASVYGWSYLKKHPSSSPGRSWFFFNLLAASMLLVVTAANGMLFVLAWEVMSLASFFLIVSDSTIKEVRNAGWIYMVATHIGTALILLLFSLLSHITESMEFSDWATILPGAKLSTAVFLLALIGFGVKAGFVPLHIWLPEAHPAAPSHISAVLSGVMIKTGIYGIVRIISFLGSPMAWWGWTLIIIGIISGILGILLALAQHDMKRLLAYSSVENIGIILMGLGLGVLGVCYENHIMAFAGFAGAFFHVINHAFFKSMLFMAAGSVLNATGTRMIDRLGGLFKRMPGTGLIFLLGAAAIAGMPPLNGFMSEFLIFISAFKGITAESGAASAASGCVVAGLAAMGGITAACFLKLFGTVFLGKPRVTQVVNARESDKLMLGSMITLGGLCVSAALLTPFIVVALGKVVQVLPGADFQPDMTPLLKLSLLWVILACVIGAILVGVAFMIRKFLLKDKVVKTSTTWGCGYDTPSARMQYTGSSFTSPFTHLFHSLMQTRDARPELMESFPKQTAFSTETPDVVRVKFFDPIFQGITKLLSYLRWLQHGKINLYILYIVITLLLLLIFKTK